MKIIQGTNRSVLVFKFFVLKFPKINKSFFGNLLINFSEFICYMIYHPGLCMPTYFSLLGFINIQKKGSRTRYADKAASYLVLNSLTAYLERYMVENNIPGKDQLILAHETCSLNNLFWDGNYLRLVDYGSWPMWTFVLKSRKNLILKKPV